jgi:hypothetical protein
MMVTGQGWHDATVNTHIDNQVFAIA